MKDAIDEILKLITWAIVGLSTNQDRPAYEIAALLQEKGHRIVPVHPKGETVHGELGYKSLTDIPFAVDVVDVFVNSSLAGDVIDEAIAIGAKAVWLQLFVLDAAGIERAEKAGLLAVMNKCPAIEYGKRS